MGSVQSTLPSLYIAAVQDICNAGVTSTTGSQILSASSTSKASVRTCQTPPNSYLFDPSHTTQVRSRSSLEVSVQLLWSGLYNGCLGIEQAVQIYFGVGLGLDHGEQQYF